MSTGVAQEIQKSQWSVSGQNGGGYKVLAEWKKFRGRGRVGNFGGGKSFGVSEFGRGENGNGFATRVGEGGNQIFIVEDS